MLAFDEPSPALDIGGTCSPTDQIGQARCRRLRRGRVGAAGVPLHVRPRRGRPTRAPTFTWTGPYAHLLLLDRARRRSAAACTRRTRRRQLPDGTYTLVVEAPDDARIIHAFTIDTVAPDAPGRSRTRTPSPASPAPRSSARSTARPSRPARRRTAPRPRRRATTCSRSAPSTPPGTAGGEHALVLRRRAAAGPDAGADRDADAHARRPSPCEPERRGRRRAARS